MKIDSVMAEAMAKAARETGREYQEVFDIIQGYYKGIELILRRAECATLVHFDYVGKFVFNEAYVKKMIALNRTQRKIKSPAKRKPYTLNEINGFGPRQ